MLILFQAADESLVGLGRLKSASNPTIKQPRAMSCGARLRCTIKQANDLGMRLRIVKCET
jgi:hypothetical protein